MAITVRTRDFHHLPVSMSSRPVEEGVIAWLMAAASRLFLAGLVELPLRPLVRGRQSNYLLARLQIYLADCQAPRVLPGGVGIRLWVMEVNLQVIL
jgi:hypothetical protein